MFVRQILEHIDNNIFDYCWDSNKSHHSCMASRRKYLKTWILLCNHMKNLSQIILDGLIVVCSQYVPPYWDEHWHVNVLPGPGRHVPPFRQGGWAKHWFKSKQLQKLFRRQSITAIYTFASISIVVIRTSACIRVGKLIDSTYSRICAWIRWTWRRCYYYNDWRLWCDEVRLTWCYCRCW